MLNQCYSNMNRNLKKYLLITAVPILLFPFIFANTTQQWENKLNKELTFYNLYSLHSLPEFGALYLFPGKYGKNFNYIDVENKTIKSICKKGKGPENFQAVQSVFVDSDNLYLQDPCLRLNKLIIFPPDNFSNFDIISTKNIKNYTVKIKAKYKDRYFCTYQKIKYEIGKDDFMNSIYLGSLSKDFKNLTMIKSFPKINGIPIFDTYFIFGKNTKKELKLIVFYEGNFNLKKEEMNVLIIDPISNKQTLVPFKIPKKFYSWNNYDKSQELFKLRTTLNLDHKPRTPSGNVRQGLDFKIYFTYCHFTSEKNIETLINILDLDSLETEQYIYQTTKGYIPYLFSKDNVYCGNNSSEDYLIKILERKFVTSNANRINNNN